MRKYKYYLASVLILVVSMIWCNIWKNETGTIATSTAVLSNKRIGWGLKRAENHIQPDLGAENKALIEKYDGIAMGNKEKKYVYLTFDNGYEAGYTASILDTLKENNVSATFFITAHYLNTASDLVERMIKEGHIIRKSHSKS